MKSLTKNERMRLITMCNRDNMSLRKKLDTTDTDSEKQIIKRMIHNNAELKNKLLG